MNSTVARRRIGLVCLAVAPMLLAAATALDPALGGRDWAQAVAAKPGQALWHTVLLHWAWVLFVPGLLGLISPIRARGRVLAAIAWPLIMFGMATFAGLVLTDVTAIAVASTVDPATMAQYDARVESYAWMTGGWQLPGIIGWGLALIITPLAAARGKVTGWWYPAAALSGTGLYLMFAIDDVPLSITGPLLLTAANVVLAIQRWNSAVEEREGIHWWHRAGAVCLILAPIAFGVGIATIPGGAFHIDSESFATDPASAQASAFFLHLGWLLFVPGMFTIAARVPKSTVVAGIAALGLLHFNGLMIGDYLALAAEQVLTPQQVSTVTSLTEGYGAVVFGVMLPGMVGALLGLILVPVAAARAGLVRWPVPVLAGLGIVVFVAIPLGRISGLLAPALLLAAYTMIARGLLVKKEALVPQEALA